MLCAILVGGPELVVAFTVDVWLLFVLMLLAASFLLCVQLPLPMLCSAHPCRVSAVLACVAAASPPCTALPSSSSRESSWCSSPVLLDLAATIPYFGLHRWPGYAAAAPPSFWRDPGCEPRLCSYSTSFLVELGATGGCFLSFLSVRPWPPHCCQLDSPLYPVKLQVGGHPLPCQVLVAFVCSIVSYLELELIGFFCVVNACVQSCLCLCVMYGMVWLLSVGSAICELVNAYFNMEVLAWWVYYGLVMVSVG